MKFHLEIEFRWISSKIPEILTEMYMKFNLYFKWNKIFTFMKFNLEFRWISSKFPEIFQKFMWN